MEQRESPTKAMNGRNPSTKTNLEGRLGAGIEERHNDTRVAASRRIMERRPIAPRLQIHI